MSMDSSRLFVRGLPPSLGEDEFRKYFSHTAPVTDAKLIPRRRIGYVGYKTAEAAACALKHHNRTFLRTSKIHVEFAKSVAELRPDRRESPEPKQTIEGPGDGNVQHGKEDPRLKEFLETMQPKTRRVWANEDPSTFMPEGQEPRTPVAREIASDTEYEPLPKRRKTAPDAEAVQTQSQAAGIHAETVDVAPVMPPPVDSTASDADWLRNRTSRLQGLEDEELDSDQERDDPYVKGQAERAKSSPAKQTSNVSSQTDEDLHEMAPKEAAAIDDNVMDERRLFVRNISYESTEDDLRSHFEQFGHLEEVHVPRSSRSGRSKGFAYIQFRDSESARAALRSTNARPYQGRLLHVMAAVAKRDDTLDEYAISQLSHKKQQQIRRKAEAATATFRWNTLFINADAAIASTAAKLGVSKAEILDPTSSSAAVKQAHAETSIIQETREFFQSNGVNLDSFASRARSETVILVKNFAYGTSTDELRHLFEGYGTVKRVLMPPAGTMAIIEFEQQGQARKAFSALAYRKLGDAVLFLEKAPKEIFDGKVRVAKDAPPLATDVTLDSSNLMAPEDQEASASATLFVKNLNFDTTSAKLYEVFLPLKGFMSARVKTKSDPRKPGQILSMGFGFVEFRSQKDAQAALAVMDGYQLDGHRLQIKASNKGLDAAAERRKEDAAKKTAALHTKIIIKNLPFETTRRDIRELFGPYGKLRAVRVPKKFDHSARGFAFAEFVTIKEAQNAMEALAGAHLLGRRLNLEYATEEINDPEKEIEAMSERVGRQVDKVAAQQLTSSSRKKFSVYQNEEDEVNFN